MAHEFRADGRAEVTDAKKRRVRIEIDPAVGFYGIARAFGGYCGAHAADAAVDHLLSSFAGVEPGLDAISQAITQANAKLWKGQEDRGPGEGAAFHIGHGCSLAGLWVTEQAAHVFHVGDCRIYRFRECQGSLDTRIESLTRPHTLAECFALPETKINTTVLARSLGAAPQTPIEVSVHPLDPGDVLLLCTDGLYSAVAGDELRTLVDPSQHPSTICTTILETARERFTSNESWRLSTVGLVVVRAGNLDCR